MKKVMQITTFVCFFSCLGAGAPAAEHEELHFDLSLDWKVAHSAQAHGVVIIEYVREGDDIRNWKELFTYHNSRLGRGKQTPEDDLNKLKAMREKECPGATQWNVIEQNESSILYEWQANPCLGWPEQHEIARIFHGKHNLFMLRYTAKVHELEPDTRAAWIKTLEAATIDSDNKSAAPEDVDSTIPYDMEKVMAALKPAMESMNCNVKEATATRVECKRPRVYANSQHAGSGGESVTAELEAQGNQTRIHITTGKGFYGRLGKVNWSTPIYQQMLKNLQLAQP
jgi:hypothetical protein